MTKLAAFFLPAQNEKERETERERERERERDDRPLRFIYSALFPGLKRQRPETRTSLSGQCSGPVILTVPLVNRVVFFSSFSGAEISFKPVKSDWS